MGKESFKSVVTAGLGQDLHGHQEEPKPSINPPLPFTVRFSTFLMEIK